MAETNLKSILDAYSECTGESVSLDTFTWQLEELERKEEE